jgi:CheY-like chemotaxis protein/anti-sigma regulatory factor (Ser/Thr protein kinase)
MPPRQPVVLVVDDEAVSRTLLDYHLQKTGARTHLVASAAAARKLVAQLGPAAIDCVITDYKMPNESGLELLLWLKQNDPNLAVIMITATTEREFVAATLRGGASDFLDKPITEAKLVAALKEGIAATALRRRLAATDRAVQAVGDTQHQMFGLKPEAASILDVCYHPCHAAGGDFINFFQLAPESFLVLTCDVSGHDLPSAFISAYFQGMVRGMIEAGQPIATVLERFNQFLLNEWGGLHSATTNHAGLLSLCACAVTVDRKAQTLTISNHGIPQVWQVDSMGRISPNSSRIDGPLGWFEQIKVDLTQIPTGDNGQLWVWTDGVEELAETLGVNPCSLATGLWRAQLRGETLRELGSARDDVLAVQIHLANKTPRGTWLPVLHEQYHGAMGPQIDALQLRWENSIKLALPELSESRRFDVLLATREAVINALKHGCSARADRTTWLTITIQPELHLVRCIANDSGSGHQYDWISPEQSDELTDLHRGLAMINRLATQVIAARQGAELTLDFSY